MWLQKTVLSPFVGSFVKAVVNALTGYLLGLNIVDPSVVSQFGDATTQIAIAIILLLITQGFSVFKNYKLVKLSRGA